MPPPCPKRKRHEPESLKGRTEKKRSLPALKRTQWRAGNDVPTDGDQLQPPSLQHSRTKSKKKIRRIPSGRSLPLSCGFPVVMEAISCSLGLSNTGQRSSTTNSASSGFNSEDKQVNHLHANCAKQKSYSNDPERPAGSPKKLRVVAMPRFNNSSN